MKIRLRPKRRRLWVILAALAVLLSPYVFSRLASPWRCVSVHSIPNADVVQPSSGRLRVACYNVAHGRGLAVSNWDGGSREERTARLDGIAQLLRKIDADVVVLNEVDFDSSWSGSVNQAQYLAEKAGYAYRAEQRNLDVRAAVWTWRFGNAVLSRYPITHAELADLPGYSTWETLLAGKKRSLICDINAGDQTVRVIGAHFSHRSESVRVESAKAIAGIAAGSNRPTIVAGDLNSTPAGFPGSVTDANGNNAIETFDNSGYFHRSPADPPAADDDLTFPSNRPSSVIDWILIPHDWRFVRYGVEDSQLSDHRPVFADIAASRAKTGSEPD